MRPLLLVALAGLALGAPLAGAQQNASLTIHLQVPDEPVPRGAALHTTGIVTLTTDWTAFVSSPNGVPVTYSVTKAPAWASVVVSPATDVFPAPSHPPIGVAYSTQRQITITIAGAEQTTEPELGTIEIGATTSAGALGRSATALGSMIVKLAPVEEPTPCPEHEALASQDAAATAPEPAIQASASPEEGGEVTVQQAGASPVSTPWLVVGAFGLVGAGVGIVVRQRLRGR